MTTLEIVVRTVGERTEEVCIKLLELQIRQSEKISVLREETHANAVQQTLLCGLDSQAEWLVAVDADMLILPNSIENIRTELSTIDRQVAVVHPAIVDKLYRMKRWGLTAYRNAILEELYESFQNIKQQKRLKIEAAAIEEFREGGKQVYYSRSVAAVHDFYQYYRDLYRKSYLNTIRNPGFNDRARNHWKKLAIGNRDYLIMLKAMDDALQEERDLSNSVRDFSFEELSERIRGLDLEEKNPLHWGDFVNMGENLTKDADFIAIEHQPMFNDYFENHSFADRARKLLRVIVPRF